MKDLVFHFGIHRTGTTTLQSVLKKNKGILRSHGIIYPSLFNLPDHVKIPWWIKNSKIELEDVLSSIKNQDEGFVETIVVSAEDFCMLNDFSFLDFFSKNYNVKVVMYIKEQSSWLESWYNQHIKWPWNKKYSSCSSDAFLENVDEFHWIDYHSTISRISSVIGKENLRVKRVSSEEVQDTTRDFIESLGISIERLHPYRHINESLSAGALEVARRLDLFDVPDASRNKLIRTIKSLDIDGDDGSKVVFSDKERLEIFNKFKESNQSLSDDFFDGKALFGEFKKRGKKPLRIANKEVYEKYIPMLCKKLSEG